MTKSLYTGLNAYEYLRKFITEACMLSEDEDNILKEIENGKKNELKIKNKEKVLKKIVKKVLTFERLMKDYEMQEETLTTREQDILNCLLEGNNYQETSEILQISIATAKTHVNRIFQKKGLILYNNFW